MGIIIRDHNKVICASKSWTRHGFLDPIAMEATTGFMAVQMCKGLGLQRVQLEWDVGNVTEVVNKGEPNGSWWGYLVGDILSTLHAIQQWEMMYALKELN